MRVRKTAAGLALAVALGSVSGGPAQADSPTASTIYVDNASGSGCTDSGSGTYYVPFCTVQAAAAVVQPGQTVAITMGTYTGQVTLTHSGTAAAPITFDTAGPSIGVPNAQQVSIGAPVAGSPAAYGLEIAGASYVKITGIGIDAGTSGGVGLIGSTNVQVTNDQLEQPAGPVPNVVVSGSSSSDTIDGNSFAVNGDAVSVESGATGTAIAGNHVVGGTYPAFLVTGAPDTDVTGNTIVTTGTVPSPVVALSGGSTGSTVENNIITGYGTALTGISVDAASASGTVLDYNIVYDNGTVHKNLYAWAGTDYASASALAAAVGQGTHDLGTNPDLSLGNGELLEGSPAIDSADANAPGQCPTDICRNVRDDDPADPNTGTGPGYYDRGAFELEDPIGITVASSAQWGAGSLTTTFTVTQTQAPWSPDVTYVYDFGDGTSTTTTSTSVTHTYTSHGTFEVQITATDADHGVAHAATEVAVGNGNSYHPVSPTRVLDTRNGTGTGGAVAKVPANGSISLRIAGVGPVPSTGIAAVVLNLTATDDPGNGFITAYPGGTSVPNTSSLNYSSGVNVPNLVTVQLGANGTISLFNGGTLAQPVDLVADLEGYYAAGDGDGFAAFYGTRLLDTRTTGSSIGVGQTDKLNIQNAFESAGYSGPPLTGITAVMLNVTVTNAHGSGFVTAFPDGTAAPNASNVNYLAGQTVPNLVAVPVGGDGTVDFTNSGTLAGPVDLVVDIYGAYTNTDEGYGFTPLPPTRVIDTRNGIGVPAAGILAADTDIQSDPSTYPQVPDTANALMMNVTVTNTRGNGVISVFPGTLAQLTTSNLNYSAGQTIANAVPSGWSQGAAGSGSLLYFANRGGGSTDLIADLYGYFS
jgi:PKD domain